MKRNMKLKVTALVAMLFMAIAVTFLSFSHADEDIQDDLLLTADATTAVDVGSKTNIDYIIANSNSTDPDVDPHYNIVEIYSDTASGLEKFADDLDFEKYVINRYSTLGEAMKGGMVNYKAYKTTSITNDSEVYFTSVITSLVIAGITLLTICGKIILVNVLELLYPNTLAASLCPTGIL